MLSPRFHSLLLFWTLAWFGIVLPGHERGVIRVPGMDAGRGAVVQRGEGASDLRWTALSSCPLCPVGSSGGEDDPAATCALCQLIATLSVPVPLDLVPTRGELLLERSAPGVESAPPRLVLSCSLGRAPPFFPA